jgi:hypothetical protein
MAYSSRPVASMSHPDRWLAFVRIVVGLYFAKSFVTKLGLVMVGGVLPLPGATERWIATMPKIVAKQAADNPILFYKHFLETIPRRSRTSRPSARPSPGLGSPWGCSPGSPRSPGSSWSSTTAWQRSGCRRGSRDFTSCCSR